MKATENLFTNINNKAICKGTEVTVTFERSKPRDILVVKIASQMQRSGVFQNFVLPLQSLWHQSQTDGRRSF